MLEELGIRLLEMKGLFFLPRDQALFPSIYIGAQAEETIFQQQPQKVGTLLDRNRDMCLLEQKATSTQKAIVTNRMPNWVRSPTDRSFVTSCFPPRLTVMQWLLATESWPPRTWTFTV